MSDLLPVTQEDREAAAEAIYQYAFSKSAIRGGQYDDIGVVQAFAAHRIRSSPPLPSDRMVERVASALWHHMRRDFIMSDEPLPKHREDFRELARAALSALSDDEGVG